MRKSNVVAAFTNNIRQYAMIIALLVIVFLLKILKKGIILMKKNVENIIKQKG